MLGSAKSPVPSCGDGYNLRGFRPEDMMYLIDIDAKCSDIPWTYDQWDEERKQLSRAPSSPSSGTPVGLRIVPADG